MNMNSTKQKWADYMRSNQNITALIIALLTLTILYSVLFQNPRPGVLDYGEYSQTLSEMGLNWTDKDLQQSSELQFVKVIEQYQVTDIKVLELLQINPSKSLIYPVSIISIICKILGVAFLTKYLSILLSTITVFCIYSIMKSLYCFFKGFAAIIGVVICFVLLCGNHIIYFNSFYSHGIYFVSLLLMVTVLLHNIVEEKNGISSMIRLLLVSLCLLNSNDAGIFLLPFIMVIIVWMFFYSMPKAEKVVTYTLVSLVLFIIVISANIRFTLENDNIFSDTQVYHGLFTGILLSTDEPEQLLDELGLPIKVREDIGKTAYLSEDNYVIGPYSQEAKDVIYSKIDVGTIWEMYLKHPRIYRNILEKTAENAVTIDTSKFLYQNRKTNEGVEHVERFVWWQWGRGLIVPSTLLGYLIFFFCSITMSCIYLFLGRKDKRKKTLGICFILFILFAIIEYLVCCAFCGFAEVGNKIHNFIICCDFIWVGIISIVIILFWKVVNFLGIKSKESILAEYEYEKQVDNQEILNKKSPVNIYMRKGFHGFSQFFVHNVLNKPGRSAALLSAFALAIMILILFCPRIGAYNNGDFGRMMSAMNIKYTEEDWKNTDELALTKVIEEYDWEEEYNYSNLLGYHADLTQSWMSAAIKIIDHCVGLKFSTVYVAILYVIMLTLSLFTILKVLFQRFGYGFLWMGIVLLFMLLDRDNLGWLNSFFGEGPAYVGLIMVIASSLYILNKNRRACTFGFLWLLFSIYFFAGSKAQCTVTTPILLLWALLLIIYHAPNKIWKSLIYYFVNAVIFICISLSVISIYKNNEDVSAKDTIFQSIFYGILMISDDPESDLIELGLDPRMAEDAGKNAYLDKAEYYCAPRTEMAEKMIYSKVNTFDVLQFYLRHPDKLRIMLDAAADAAAEPLPDFVLYVGQKTTENHDIVSKFGLWSSLRANFSLTKFWQLVIFYGVILIISIRRILSKKYLVKDKLLIGLYLIIAAIGIIQFPLTVIGNGFADNTKQLYIFRLTYDITVIMGFFLCFLWFKEKNKKITTKLVERENLKTGGKLINNELYGEILKETDLKVTDISNKEATEKDRTTYNTEIKNAIIKNAIIKDAIIREAVIREVKREEIAMVKVKLKKDRRKEEVKK